MNRNIVFMRFLHFLTMWSKMPLQRKNTYRKIYLYFDMDMALMPDFAYSMIKRTIGLKTADKGYRDDNQSVCEPYSFVVESYNKLIKQFLSWGPSLYHWLSACRTFNIAAVMTKNLNKFFNFKRYDLDFACFRLIIDHVHHGCMSYSVFQAKPAFLNQFISGNI